MNCNRQITLSFGLALVLLLTGVTAQADGLDSSEYRISGYTFDSDAVSESESGLLFETSRFKPLMITSSTTDVFGEDPFGTSFSSQVTGAAPHGFAVAAEYLPTPSLAFHGAIGVTSVAWDGTPSEDLESSWRPTSASSTISTTHWLTRYTSATWIPETCSSRSIPTRESIR